MSSLKCFFFLLSPDPPLVSITPSSVIANQSDTVIITCDVFGIPVPSVQWTRGTPASTVNITETTTITETRVGNNITSVLTIQQVQRSEMDTYTCAGSNGISNLINSPQQASSQLFVQGWFFKITTSTDN